MIKLTVGDFVRKAIEIHGNKYDYSKADYVNSQTKVCIICPIHGEFWQTPNNHVNLKQGCSRCFHESVKRPVYGVGINDTNFVFETKDYKIWRNMLERCYCEKTQNKYPTYKGCEVCEEWKLFSNFKKWFRDNYVEGWELDKDILSINNKIYSTETCCFVPREINSLLRRSNVNKFVGIYPTKTGKYFSTIRVEGKQKRLGVFNSFDEAKNARDNVFRDKLDKIISKYIGVMPKHVIDACLAYSKALSY